jgi:cytochrome c peroxidase
MKRWIGGLLLLFGLIIVAFISPKEQSDYSKNSLEDFKRDSKLFSESLSELKTNIQSWHNKQDCAECIQSLKECRLKFKRIEAFMEYYFEYPVNLYNRAPVFELEEPYMEYQSPVGLQYIESLLLADDAFSHKKEILDQCEVLDATARDIPGQLFALETSDEGLIDANRLELVRIISLGISGYDAPQLKTGLSESAEALAAMNENLQPLLQKHPGKSSDSIRLYLNRAIAFLNSAKDFDQFDRLQFLTEAALPLQKQLRDFSIERGLTESKHRIFNAQSEHLFSPDAIQLNDSIEKQKALSIELGKALFHEKALSGNISRSCATCHNPNQYFTDGLSTSLSLDGKTHVSRNAPTLYYAAFQHAQFYDSRAESLEKQIDFVLQNPREMNANLDSVVKRLDRNPAYRTKFRAAFATTDNISMNEIRVALASYEQSLAPFNSEFDRYIAGDHNAMKPAAKAGFNLFMGKAQCGTCHFAPLFNGLLPPFYERTELEILGVPQKDTKGKWHSDRDSGRFAITPIAFNNGAFKTPTVRNSAMTAPYMHNGVFKNLKELIDFYNKGGGRGLGLSVPQQTLSDQPLKLSSSETEALIAFLKSLTDRP